MHRFSVSPVPKIRDFTPQRFILGRQIVTTILRCENGMAVADRVIYRLGDLILVTNRLYHRDTLEKNTGEYHYKE